MTLLLERPIALEVIEPPAPTEPVVPTMPIAERTAWICTTSFGMGLAYGHVTWGSQKPTGKCPKCWKIR